MNRFTPHFFLRQQDQNIFWYLPFISCTALTLQKDYEELQSRISVLKTKEALMIEYLGIAKSKLREVFGTLDDLDKVLRS